MSVWIRKALNSCWLILAFILAACASTPQPSVPERSSAQPNSSRPIGYFDSIVSAFAPPTPVVRIAPPTSAAAPETSDGLRATLRFDPAEPGAVHNAEKAAALATLRDFADPLGPYQGAWWFADDGQARIEEALAVILFTEGSTNEAVRKAVAARYVWFCGGAHEACQGVALINFLAYFQPWREPWRAAGRFTDSAAKAYAPLAIEVMRPSSDSVDWARAPFHFANIHPTWDRYLRAKLRREPDGPDRLWVLTQAEAERVCVTALLCSDMTRPRP